jgi:hypothetical protein
MDPLLPHMPRARIGFWDTAGSMLGSASLFILALVAAVILIGRVEFGGPDLDGPPPSISISAARTDVPLGESVLLYAHIGQPAATTDARSGRVALEPGWRVRWVYASTVPFADGIEVEWLAAIPGKHEPRAILMRSDGIEVASASITLMVIDE